MRLSIALIAASLLSCMPAMAQESSSSGSAEFTGGCVPNPPLANVVKAREKAASVGSPACNRAVVEWGKTVVFYDGEKEVLRFSGKPGDATDITLETVSVKGSAASAATNGRCRFYKNDGAGTIMIVCFGAFQDSKMRTQGAVAMFEARTR